MFNITIAQRAQKGSKKLPEHLKRRIVELLLILRENPVPAEYYDVKKLKGLADTYTRIELESVILELFMKFLGTKLW